jgi:acyl-CoA synthetase (AMP-forming)/AMP-acid ligase II
VWGGRKYFFAGDMGYVDEGGWFHPVGRMGIEVIKSGGENVYAEEVEDVLKAHPKVEDAAVVGISDANLGEMVVAIVALERGAESSEEELIKHCQDNLPEHKVPGQVIFVESIPRLSSGKMDRRMLKEFAEGRLGGRHTGLTQYFA